MSVNFKTFMRHTTVYWCQTSQQCGWFKDLLSMFTNSDLDWYVSSGQNGERFQDQYFRITSKPSKVLNLTAHYCFDSLLWYVCRTLSLFCLAVNFSDLCYLNSQTTMLHKLVDSSNTFHTRFYILDLDLNNKLCDLGCKIKFMKSVFWPLAGIDAW